MKLALLTYVLAAVLNIVPQPESIEMASKGTFKVHNSAINCDPAIGQKGQNAIRTFTTTLILTHQGNFSMATPMGITASAEKGLIKGFAFIKDSTIPSEGYKIEVTPKYVKVSASDDNGVIYAIQTLKQMLPVSVYGKKADSETKWELPCCTIKDAPRFAYRGMHLDCGRHFFSIAEVKKYLDVMAMFKINRFHWHLTEDQGWRVEIKKYPRLTEIGAWRSGTQVGHDANSSDGVRYGGYYTQDQIREVVAYADALGITVIPEIDLPGHMLAALASYPYLGCTGGPYAPWVHWGISKDVLCVGKESTFKFLEDVLGELCELFPGEYFHIGGDECPKDNWKTCPECQALIAKLGLKSDDKATAEQRLQNYVTSRMQAFLATKGKKIIGWDEILEGELSKGATVMSWRGVKGGIEAAENGFDAIMTPNQYCYLDYCQSDDPSKEPLCIGGCLPMEKVYSYEPYDGMAPEATKHIIGVQANLWTEYIGTDDYLEYMLLPRMLAVSEIQWCKKGTKDYDRFLNAVREHEYKIFDTMGYNYRKY